MKIKDILQLPNIEIGDEILVGKFKNRKATVTGFDIDDNNQPVLKTTKGDQKLFKPRLVKLLDNGKFCHLQEPDSLNFGVNSFWLFAARESFSFYEIGKEMPDHFMTHYITNMKACASSKDEVLWKDRLQYINHEGMLGEFGKKKDK